jgi:hypothetical protein
VGFAIDSRGGVLEKNCDKRTKINNIIKFISLFSCAASTAKRPITDTAQQILHTESGLRIHFRCYIQYYNNKSNLLLLLLLLLLIIIIIIISYEYKVIFRING